MGSTALAERLDPEDLQHLVRLYQEWAVEILARHEGRVAQYLGDGILVYFGYPQAREDSTTQAIRAALELVHRLPDLGDRLERAASTRASIRVGVHTGLVVVGRMGTAGRSEQLALGETPNVAARLQALAEPGTALVSEATHRLTRHQFAYDALGPHSLRGLSRPVEVYRALREEAASSTPRAPMVNRRDEISWLEERLARARGGDGARALIVGDAGLGKSRLVTHLRKCTEVTESPPLWVEVACSAQYRTSPLYPLLGALARTLGLRRADDEATRLRKIEETLQARAPHLPQAPALFALLFGLPVDDPQALELTPSLRRSRTLEALVRWFVTLADLHALVLVVEDLQWSDPSTLEWLEALLSQVPEHPLFVVVTQRAGTGPISAAFRDVEILRLDPLERRHVLELVDGVAGDRQLPANVLAHLIDKTDGVPLFVEELTRDILEGEPGDGPVDARSIPSTLQDSLMARLDRLGPDKDLAQWAAVLGREFPHEWLAAVVPGRTEVPRSLERLIDAGILEARGTPPRAVYQFRHALLQDAAYGSLLRRHRRRRHRQVADVLEEHFPRAVARRPEELAHHATEGHDFDRAVRAWLAAGEQAVGRSALQEAEMHLNRGLVLVDELSDDVRRAEWELGLRRLLGSALLAARGYADRQVEINYQRARELGREMGPSRELFDALRGLHPFFLVRAQHGEARDLAHQLLDLARELDREDLEIEARLTLATSAYWTGDVGESLKHAEGALALYDPRRHREHTSIYGQDPAVLAQVYAGWCHAWLGRPATAMEISRDAVERARDLAHPHTLVMALDHFCVLHQHLEETDGVGDLIEECGRLSARYGFAMWSAMAGFRQGWLDGRSGEPDGGITRLRAGLTAFETTGARIAQPLHWAYLAETCRLQGRIDEGLEAVARARQALKHGERQWEPELPRLEGELLWLRDGPSPEVEPRFRRALELARELGSGMLELRAALSLARWLDERGKPGAAEAVLQPPYHRMEQGIETPDLSAARSLLSSLSTASSGRP